MRITDNKVHNNPKNGNLCVKVGEAVRQKRKQLGISQRDLAALLGLSDHSSMVRLEKGNENISLLRLEELADALKVLVPELLGYACYMHEKQGEFPESILESLQPGSHGLEITECTVKFTKPAGNLPVSD